MKEKSKLLKILIIIFVIVFSISIFKVINIKYKGLQEEKAFESLRQSSSMDKSYKKYDDEKEDIIYTKYRKLYEENNDFSAWLNIAGTEIDYPVMYTPNEPRFYLRRGFDKEYALSGTPFIGKNGNIESDMFIIYAHNMSNGTMFSKLDFYKDEDFYKEHKIITLTTPSEKRVYEVFASVKTKVPIKEGVAYYNYSGDLDEDSYSELVNYLLENSLINTDVIPKYNEQIIILSTCSYHTDDGRFLVAAKRIV